MGQQCGSRRLSLRWSDICQVSINSTKVDFQVDRMDVRVVTHIILFGRLYVTFDGIMLVDTVLLTVYIKQAKSVHGANRAKVSASSARGKIEHDSTSQQKATETATA